MAGMGPGMGGYGDDGFSGAGSASGIAAACRGHSEADLQAASRHLAVAQEEAQTAEAAAARARSAEWSGPAAAAFRMKAEALRLQIAALATGLAGLAALLVALQADAAACPGAGGSGAGGPGPLTSVSPPGSAQGPVFAGPVQPLVPQPALTPLLPAASPSQPVFLAQTPGAQCR